MLACAALFVLLGCASSPQSTAGPATPGQPPGSIRFKAYVVTQDPLAPIQPSPSVTVFLASQGRLRMLGITDMNGLVTVQKDQIWVSGARMLYFCVNDVSQCSTLKLEGESSLRRLTEFSVEVSDSFSVVD
jgi:hypothetical protein